MEPHALSPGEWIAVISTIVATIFLIGGALYKILDKIFSSEIKLIGLELKAVLDVHTEKFTNLTGKVEALAAAKSQAGEDITQLSERVTSLEVKRGGAAGRRQRRGP